MRQEEMGVEKSTMQYEWGIIVFGENNKQWITHEMMRSFADMFHQNSLKLGLNLVQSPSFLFTKNVVMAQREVEMWCEELESDKNEIFVLFFNDSDSNEVEEKMQEVLREKVLLYSQSSDNLLRCARDETEKIIGCWIKEVCERLSERFHGELAVKFGSDGTKGTDSIKINDIGAIVHKKLSNSENQEEHEINTDFPLLDFAHVENILSDLQKLEKPLKYLDLVKYIDTSMLRNRLLIPFIDREQNGRLLALLSAASVTELPDLQSTVVNFVENILKSGFISFVLRENVYYIRNVATGGCNGTLFIYLQDIMHILYTAKVNHIQNFSIAYDEFLNFMELIPEKCWSAINEGFQLTVFKMLQKLTVASGSLTLDLYEDHALNVIDNSMQNFDNRVSLNLVKKYKHKNYKPAWISTDDVEPPGDFRTLSICPTSNDILHPARPYIRKNIVKGSYLNQEHYLDIQFRLMREDLIGPLRDGIKFWKQQKEKGIFLSCATDTSEEFDLLVIRGVIVEGAQLKRSTGEVIRYITFEPLSADNSYSSRLKYGQLVTLSSDEFQNEALLATIAERDPDEFLKGRLGLCFFNDHSVSRAKIYILVESNSYYEMYQHVLECIKRFDDEQKIPFERFLLKAETDVRLPAYLIELTDEDFLSISDSSSSEYTDYSGPDSLTKKTVIAKEISIFGTKYVVDKLKYTLDGEKISLDDAQRNALCHALTHELALIQGPPGTGKTFLGRFIVRILLENMNMWNPDRINPILVVCFTNHALDQFLDGILVDLIEDGRYSDELPSIVRIGSRCKSETLLRYTKWQVLDAHTNLISVGVRNQANHVMLERIHLLELIRTQVAVLSLRKIEILSFEHIQRTMLQEHIRQFKLQRQNNSKRCSADEIFCRWLLEGDIGKEDCIGDETDMNEKIIDFESKKFFGNESSPEMSFFSMDGTFVRKEGNEQKKEMLRSIPEMDEWTTWKEIQERLLKINPNVDDYYHSGEWDLDKDPNASSIKPVTIFSNQAKCNAELITSLMDVKTDILKSSPLTLEEASSIKDLQTLHRHRRWALYMHWVNELKVVITKKLDALLNEYQTLMRDIKKEFEFLDEIVLRKALIIGATTTGAAKIKPFLDRLGCPIVIVEEAGEVLEAHVLTSITKKCQHAILIGDHQQLRPNPAVFTLAREYNLDISLFERLIKNDFPYAALEKQHRMAIAISKTIMPEFYPFMKDADNVLNYPDVKGCQKNLYFINHLHEEDMLLSTSHRNSFEGDFMVNLYGYFVQQGYASSQITLLCAYTAQASYVKTQMMLKFSNESFPLVETIDNYQGKENDIIILSLVRSQPSSSIGFLGISNRVCVALSRSKLGLYVIGNMHFLRSNSFFWNRLYITLANAGYIGDGFPAFCVKHNVTQIIHNADEFLTKTPEGGCYYPCNFIRSCGHMCSQPCHRVILHENEHDSLKLTKLMEDYEREKEKSNEEGIRIGQDIARQELYDDKINLSNKNQFRTDQEHKGKCTQSCPKTCSTIFRHPCAKLCGEDCGACQFFESKTFPCGHTTDVVCHLFEKAMCQQKCPKKLSCGYQCVEKCNDPCKCSHKILLDCGHTVIAACSEKQKAKCIVEVDKIFTTCSHHCAVPCHNYENAKCSKNCERLLPCGHRCQSLCGNCTLVGCNSCTSLCGKRLSCGHNCLRTCGVPCEPCIAPCSNQCGHSHCGQQLDILAEGRSRCGDICSFCVQRCMNSCKHRECQMQCWQVCNINPCNFSCDKKLKCGHTCLSLCGEICPDVCVKCQGISVHVLQFQGCRCIVSVEEADLHIQAQKLKKQQYTCPKCSCKLPANGCFRYAREFKEQVISNERIKFTKLLTNGLSIDLQYDVLKQAEDDLAKIMQMKGRKRDSIAMEVAELLHLVIIRLNTEFYNHLGIMKWQAMVNMLSDLCRLTIHIITEKFTSIPKKRFSNLYILFNDCLGTTNNLFSSLEKDLLNLLMFAKLLKNEAPSMLEIPMANGLRKVSVKYMLGRLANDFIRKLRDLNVEQFNHLLEMTMKALNWSSDAEQKKASIQFVQYYHDLYGILNIQHMLVNDLQCMNFPY